MKGTQALFGLILIVVGIILFPMVMTAFHDTLTDDATTQGNVTTGSGVTTATVSIPSPGLYSDSLTSVTSITSSYGSDVPAASSYATATDVLTIGGLVASQTRVLTVAYEYEAGAEYTGFTDFGKLGPLLLMLSFLGSGIGLVVTAFRGRG